MSYWVYKCNRRGLNGPAWGDWEDVFRGNGPVQWGQIDIIPALEDLQPGDTLLAYQTDRNELVGTARVEGFKGPQRRRHVMIRAVERLGAKVRPLKKADPKIAQIQALQGGIVATIYTITDEEARRLIDAARRSRPTSRRGRTSTYVNLSDDAVEDALESARLAAQGFTADPERRKVVERFAVDRARSHYEKLGYQVEERGRPFDLECRKQGRVLHVEVKGSQSRGGEVILTRNEVEHAKNNSMELFVVHSIRVTRGPTGYVTSGGMVRVVRPWRPNPQDLVPLVFLYAID